MEGDKVVNDERGQVAGWLIRLILVIGIIGFLLLEFGAVLINRVQATDLASEAAVAAGLTYFNTRSLERAESQAEELIRGRAELLDVALDRQRNEIAVTLRKTASTQVLHRFEATEGLTEYEVTQSAPLRN